jgi:hypothetical protein
MSPLQRFAAVCVFLGAVSVSGCDARLDPNTGSGSQASAPAAAASRQQLDPH